MEEAGRALLIAFNKWDLTNEERRRYLNREIERDLVQFAWSSRVNISAGTGRHVDRLQPAIDEALGNWEKRISTGKLNAFLGRIVAGDRTRSAAASSRGSCSAPRLSRVRRPSSCSRPVRSKPATSAS